MDIFRFNNPTAPTKLEQGEIINDLKSKMWIERYRTAGEFTLVANVETGMRERLPIGSLISHVDSQEVMIVESHEISEQKGKETEIEITGRGFETALDHRIVGSNKTFPVNGAVTDYTLAAAYVWQQAVSLISDHILAANLIDDDNEIPYVSVMHDVTGTGVSQARAVKRGSLYTRLLEILAVEQLGIKVVRPGPWSPLTAGSPNVALVIHKGVDRSNEVIFSNDTGEIDKADYLWSNKNLKNCALVSGNWVEVFVDTAETSLDRRMIFVDGSDIDGQYPERDSQGNELPIPYTTIQAAMQQRGIEALASKNSVALTRAEASRENVKAGYRTDFNVGDIITVNGDYDETTKRRINEYVEIEDANGSSGYPTFETVE